MNNIEHRERGVIMLRAIGDDDCAMTYKQIADIIGVDATTVKATCARAISKFTESCINHNIAEYVSDN